MLARPFGMRFAASALAEALRKRRERLTRMRPASASTSARPVWIALSSADGKSFLHGNGVSPCRAERVEEDILFVPFLTIVILGHGCDRDGNRFGELPSAVDVSTLHFGGHRYLSRMATYNTIWLVDHLQ